LEPSDPGGGDTRSTLSICCFWTCDLSVVDEVMAGGAPNAGMVLAPARLLS
jgi:hypothetical protein